MSGLLGSQGARAGAHTAMAMRIPTTTAPPHASWLREKVRQKRRSSPRRERAGPGTSAPPTPGREADAWIHHPVREIGEEVGEKRQARHDDEIAHDDGVVAREHRLDHELPHARDGEDALDDDAAADETGQGEPEDGDHGQERVAKGVLADDHGLGQSLGAGGLDIVLTDHLEHALAHVARESRETAEGSHGHGQEEMAHEVPLLAPEGHVLVVERPEPGNRQPIEVDPEEDHQEQGQPEVGRGEADEDEDRRDLVEERVLPRGRGDPDGNGQGEDDQELQDVQEERDGQALADLREDGPRVGLEGAAEVQANDPAQPPPVLDVKGLVETELLVELLNELGVLPRFLAAKVVEGPARGQLDDEEGYEGDPDEERDG